MLCSDCGKRVLPVVAFDLDGTLCDYHGHLIRFAYAYFGRQAMERLVGVPEMVAVDTYAGDVRLADHLHLTNHDYRQMKLAYRQGGQKRMQPAFAGAGEAVFAAMQEGCEVWITTTRPYMRFDSTDPDTRHWLERMDLPYDHLVYEDDKYKVLFDTVGPERVVMVLDDLPEQVHRARDLGLPAVQRATRYNRKARVPSSVPTVTDLRQVPDVLSSRLLRAGWKEE